MLSHDLILSAAEHATAARTPVGVQMIQRKVRVGYATGHQLLSALVDVGVVADMDGTGRCRVLVDTFDRKAVTVAVDAAVAAGKFELDGEPCAVCRAGGRSS